jgi:hypothetical protein
MSLGMSKRSVSVTYTPKEVLLMRKAMAIFDALSRDATYAAQIDPEDWRRIRQMLARPVVLMEKRSTSLLEPSSR